MRVTFCYRHIAPYHHAQLNALALQGTNVTVISCNNFSDAAFSEENFAIPHYNTLLLATQDDSWRFLNRLLNESKPAVVLVPGWGHAYALAALAWSLQNQVPCIAISDSQERDYSRNLCVEAIKTNLVKLFAAGFVAGQRSKAYLIKLGIPEERITIGCDVLDNSHFAIGSEAARKDPEAYRLSLGLPDRYFLAVNRLIPEKNIHTIINAYVQYRADGAPGGYDLVLVGEGPIKNELKALAVSLNVEDNIIFKGSVNYATMPVLYGLASALVLASVQETWGFVINEAMSAGLPVVVSEHCGSSLELVQQGRNGFIFNPHDVTSLKNHMLELASLDSEKALNMGLCSRDIIAEWSLDRYVENILKIVDIARATPPPIYGFFSKMLLKFITYRLLQNEKTH